MKELLDLKKQYESDILLKTNKAQYERIKCLIREDSEDDIEKVIAKELGGASIVKFIKIYHYEIEVERCQKNIEKWREKLQEATH